MAEFTPEGTEEIVCPWCGYEFEDSWEFDDDDVTECYGCDKRFKHHRFIDVTYDTEKIES